MTTGTKFRITQQEDGSLYVELLAMEGQVAADFADVIPKGAAWRGIPWVTLRQRAEDHEPITEEDLRAAHP